MSFYTVRTNAKEAIGSYGPLDNIDDLYHYGDVRRLRATEEQEFSAGWCNGPHLSNMNARMVMRSLDYEDSESWQVDAHDLKSRLLLALAVGGTIDDGGQPEIISKREGRATMIISEIPAGYLERIYGQMLDVAEQAIVWETSVSVC